VQGVHFTVDYSDPGNPSVALRTGSLTWNVRSDDDGDPGDIGNITVNPTQADNFEVTIANGSNPGAANVASIDLSDTTGYTSLDGGEISGGLTTLLKLVQGIGGTGGDISGIFEIGGKASGEINVPVISGGLKIDGDVTNKVKISDELRGGGLWIVGDALSSATIRIVDMVSDGQENSAVLIEGDVDCNVELDNGVPANQAFEVVVLTDTGSIDLNGEDVAGTLGIVLSSAGTISDGGAVTSSGKVRLTTTGGDFTGEATFASVAAGGLIETLNGDHGGDLTITGDMAGDIEVNDLLSGGLISVGGDVTTDGAIAVDDTAAGDIAVTVDLVGNVSIGVHAEGDIDIDGDVTGGIDIDGTLKSTGRILIDGLCDGPITIGQETVALSQIKMTDGLGQDGSITINDGLGNYDAEGTIYIGAAGLPLPSVTYDGSITILAPSEGHGGDLDGSITVVGCHETEADLDLCICGNNNGTLTITQGGCENQVDWSSPLDACCSG
jgi:hypothetical protein